MNTFDHVLLLLKTQGAHTAQELAKQLNLTSMAVRKHLEQAHAKTWVDFEDRAMKQGRPARYWSLTQSGHTLFPDRHEELSVQLLNQIQAILGAENLNKVIQSREHELISQYREKLSHYKSFKGKLTALAQLRSNESYMAEIQTNQEGEYTLIENHCPICAAAKTCPQLCQSELNLFRQTLGEDFDVRRVEHQLGGDRRCVYLIRPSTS